MLGAGGHAKIALEAIAAAQPITQERADFRHRVPGQRTDNSARLIELTRKLDRLVETLRIGLLDGHPANDEQLALVVEIFDHGVDGRPRGGARDPQSVQVGLDPLSISPIVPASAGSSSDIVSRCAHRKAASSTCCRTVSAAMRRTGMEVWAAAIGISSG